MRCLGSESIPVDAPAVTLTRVRFSNEYASRSYEISEGMDIEYMYDTQDYSQISSGGDMCDNECDNGNDMNNEITSIRSEMAATSSNSQSEVSERNYQNIELSSAYTTQTADDTTPSQNGVVLISLRQIGNDLPEADDSESQSGIVRQFSQSVEMNYHLVSLSTTRSSSPNSYDIIQETHDNPTDDVISMRLTRSALSEELMSRPPPSYERIVDLTDGAYVKPLPPSYDSIFQTNKM